MPAPKGSNNARSYQEALVLKNKELIERELHQLKSVRAKFESITALSQAVAKATGISDVTIRRNSLYRSLIATHMNETRTRPKRDSTTEAEISKLRHRVLELELKLSNAVADNNRLRKFSLIENRAPESVPEISNKLASGCNEIDWEHACIQTFFLVKIILARAFFEVNIDDRTIFDRTGIGDDEIVAGTNIAGPYVDWLKKAGGHGSS